MTFSQECGVLGRFCIEVVNEFCNLLSFATWSRGKKKCSGVKAR